MNFRRQTGSLARACRDLLPSLWPLLVLPLAPLLEFAAAVDLGRVAESWALVLTLVLLTSSSAASARLLRRPKTALMALAAGCWLLLAGSVFSPHEPPTGDEPAYLVIASSLARDGDLELVDDYREEAWRAFGVSDYRPFLARGGDGKLRAHHGPGMGLLLAPFVALFDAIRPWLGLEAGLAVLRILPGLAMGLYLCVAYQLAVEAGASPDHALAAAVAAGLSCPLLFYSTQLYPDVPGGLLLALLALERTPAAGAAAAMLLLPQLGIKFVPPMCVLAAGLLLRLLRAGRRGAALTVGSGLMLGLTAFFVAGPPADLEARLGSGAVARLANLPWWLYGYLFDQRAGLLALAPIFLVAVAGFRRLRLLQAGPALAAAAVYVGIYAYHLDWGGRCPPGRPLLAVLWLAVVLLALGLGALPSGRVRALAFVSGLVSAAYLLDHRLLFLHLHPNAQAEPSPLLAAWSLPDLDLTRLAPFVSVDHTTTAANLGWLLILLAAAPLFLRVRSLRTGPALGAAASIAALLGMLAWGSRIDPTLHLPSLSTGLPAAALYTDAGPGWTDGWLPGGRRVSCWIRSATPVRLRLQSLVDASVEVRGHGVWSRLNLGPGSPAELLLPGPGPGLLARIEIQVAAGVVPAEVSASPDRRRLGVRVSVAP